MAHYTLHLVFSANGTVYHIYGAAYKNRSHEFGGAYGLKAEQFHRVDIVKLEKDSRGAQYIDHGHFGTELFAKDAPLYTALARGAVDSGKQAFVINCQGGMLRTRILAARIYMMLTGCEAQAALDLIVNPQGEREVRFEDGNAPLAKGARFNSKNQVSNMKAALGEKT